MLDSFPTAERGKAMRIWKAIKKDTTQAMAVVLMQATGQAKQIATAKAIGTAIRTEKMTNPTTMPFPSVMKRILAAATASTVLWTMNNTTKERAAT